MLILFFILYYILIIFLYRIKDGSSMVDNGFIKQKFDETQRRATTLALETKNEKQIDVVEAVG